MKALREWLKWRIARAEMQELEIRRTEAGQAYRWLASMRDHCLVLDNIELSATGRCVLGQPDQPKTWNDLRDAVRLERRKLWGELALTSVRELTDAQIVAIHDEVVLRRQAIATATAKGRTRTRAGRGR